jgi:flavin reductase (DIM6/NTAB) family NADH-FMN oxidoreductase RutF
VVSGRNFSFDALRATLAAECYANLECRVLDTRMVNKYNFFILEVVGA